MTEYKVGDVVHVRGVVTDIFTDCDNDPRPLFLVAFDDRESASVWRSEIVTVEPRQLKVGDTVRIKNMTGHGKIVAIDGDEAWVKWNDCKGHSTSSLANLERP